MNLITIQHLATPQQIEQASGLLYDVYIRQQDWRFSTDNPAGLRIEKRGTQSLLIDDGTNRAIWFGAFDDERLVGCIRLLGVDENNLLEVEKYPSSQSIRSYIPFHEKARCYEISKLATAKNYVGRGIVKRLFLACFRYCQENKSHILATSHNGYVQSLFKKIEFPLKKGNAFKYEPHDPMEVNFYFADYKKSEVDSTLKNLEYLENDLSNNARTIFKALQTVESILPTPFYWMNTQGIVLGINDLCLQAIGTTREIIGKKPYAFYKPEIAEYILKHNTEVINKEAILAQEEWIEDVTSKERKCFSSIKAPLYDDNGNVIGIVGTSIEVTAQKEAEQLRLKYELNKNALEEQEKFRKVVDQVAHDIRSPLMSLLMVVKNCQSIPERERITLREAATTIDDIANNLLSAYGKKADDNDKAFEEREDILVSPVLLQLLTEKKYQYQNFSVKFDYDFTPAGNFAWIKSELTAFKRMLSNIINNAVDSVEQKEGKIVIHLDASDKQVKIRIADNGKGMKPELVEKILGQIAVTEGKKNGHGIGLTQVRETLQNNHGQLGITSEEGVGTTVTLTFPWIPAQDWIAESIELNKDDIVVIVDDDMSIHLAWGTRFDPIESEFPQLILKHYDLGEDAIRFINALAPDQKRKVFLLTDYELLKQNLNGLDVIRQTDSHRSVLVTSHYAKKSVRDNTVTKTTKILPKQLAHLVPITITEQPADQNPEADHHDLKKVDAIFVDDDLLLLHSYTYIPNKEIDTYHNVDEFLNKVAQYRLDTRIFVDNNFDYSNLTGFQILEQLHKKGFSHLFLLTGETLSGKQIPPCIKVIQKGSMETMDIIYRILKSA